MTILTSTFVTFKELLNTNYIYIIAHKLSKLPLWPSGLGGGVKRKRCVYHAVQGTRTSAQSFHNGTPG